MDAGKKLVAVFEDQKIKECASLDGDIKKVEAWGSKIFTNPAAILTRVIKNHSDIMKKVPAVETDYDAGQFKQSGDDIAAVVVDIFGAAGASAEETLYWNIQHQ